MHYIKYLDQARLHADKLRSLLQNYHPRSRAFPQTFKEPAPLPITAGGAEAACQVVRRKISQEDSGKPHPVAVFNIALEVGTLQAAWGINSLLNAAWFGVPESTACWQIEGFREAVDLMEDTPKGDSKDEP